MLQFFVVELYSHLYFNLQIFICLSFSTLQSTISEITVVSFPVILGVLLSEQQSINII
jgi:hypothetical protein